MAYLWYCCGCNFGPFNSELYDSCYNCGKYACSMCHREKVNYNSNSHAHSHANNHKHNHSAHGCHEPSPYPAPVGFNTVYSPLIKPQTMSLTGLGDLHSIRTLSRRMPVASTAPLNGAVQVYSQTYMYICCRCGDGPKVYNVQPRCIVCDHEACSSCQEIK